MSDKKQSILHKIKHLLDKANSTDSPEEAQACVLTAQQMLQKYNIEMSEIETHEVKDGITEITIPFFDYWEDVLLKGIVDNNFCDAIKIAKDKINVIGTPTNTQIVTYLYAFLRGAILRMSIPAYQNMVEEKKKIFTELGVEFNEKLADKTLKNKFLKDYVDGAVSGVIAQMNMKRRMDTRTEKGLKDLIVVNNAELVLYLKQKYPKLKAGKAKKRKVSEDYLKGVEDGKRIEIRGGVDGATGEIRKEIL